MQDDGKAVADLGVGQINAVACDGLHVTTLPITGGFGPRVHIDLVKHVTRGAGGCVARLPALGGTIRSWAEAMMTG
jgi:hypothetical protein